MGKNRGGEEETEERTEETSGSTSGSEDTDERTEEEEERDTTSAGDDSGDEGDDSEDDEEFDEERARQTIKNLRGIEKDLKKQLKELKPYKAKAEKADKDRQRREREAMSVTEKLETERDEAQEQLKEVRSDNNRLVKQLQRMRFLEQSGWDVKTARRAWNSLGDIDVEPKFDKDGKTTNMQAVKRALKEYDSDLFGPGSVNGGGRDESAPDPKDMNVRMKAALGG